MTEEIWKPVPSYEETHIASNIGRVRSLDRVIVKRTGIKKPVVGRFLSVSPMTTVPSLRYAQVCISDNCKRTTFKIHRLVGLLFVPNPDNKPHINHKDGNKANNHYTNLEWCTHSENIKHAYDTGLLKSYMIGKPARNARPIIAIRDMAIMEFTNMGQCTKSLQMDHLTFSKFIDTGIPYHDYLFYSL